MRNELLMFVGAFTKFSHGQKLIRIVQPDAFALLNLARNDSSCVTGTTVVIDGGALM